MSYAVFEKNMAMMADSNGPDAVQRFWDKDWHELNVTIDIAEKNREAI